LQDLPKFTQIWIFGLKIYHLATLVREQSFVSGDIHLSTSGHLAANFWVAKGLLDELQKLRGLSDGPGFAGRSGEAENGRGHDDHLVRTGSRVARSSIFQHNPEKTLECKRTVDRSQMIIRNPEKTLECKRTVDRSQMITYFGYRLTRDFT
jgi:hypothetical protein